jgi:hypothetical protein
MSAPKKLSGRALRRETIRRSAKLARDLERLARLSPGGAPDRPIELASASQVEVHARSMPCPICQGEVRVDEHVAETIEGARLRVAAVTCSICGASRRVYFRLGTALPS